MITLDALNVHFGPTHALRDFSARFTPGSVTALVGGDGAGKTTLLRTLASRYRRRELGLPLSSREVTYQAATGGVWLDLTVRENLDFVAQTYRLDRAEARERTGALIAAAGLVGAENRTAAKLSGGMRQKLGVIMAMLPRPGLLLLDEPTTGVDPESRENIWGLIRQAAGEGAIVVLATTYLDEAAGADQVILMDAGVNLAHGTAAEVIAAAPGRVTAAPAQPRQVLDLADQRTWQRGHTVYTWEPAPAGTAPADTAPHADTASTPAEAPADLELATVAFLLSAMKGEAEPWMENQSGLDLPANETLIDARGVTMRFGDFTALDGVDLTVKSGEIVGLIGGNGAGKSTLIRLILGLNRPTSGEIALLGASPGHRARAEIGYVPQSLGLYPTLTPAENLAFTRRVFKAPRPTRPLTKSKELTGSLPLGEQRKLATECALSHRPRLLILDEPTSGMDALSRAQLWKILRQVAAQGVGVLVTTHYQEEAQQCDRLVKLAAGRVVN